MLFIALLLEPAWALTQTEAQKIVADDGAAVDEFGVSVAVSGDTAVIGAYWDDDPRGDSGSAHVFTRNDGVWSEQGKLTASDGAPNDWFGWSVAVSGDTVVIGAYKDDDNGTDSGSAYVFTRYGRLGHIGRPFSEAGCEVGGAGRCARACGRGSEA